MRSCWRSKVALTPIGTFRGAEAGTRPGGGFASGVVGQSLSRGYGSCRTLVRSSRERAAERREALPEKGRPAGRRAGLTFNNTTRRSAITTRWGGHEPTLPIPDPRPLGG